jgi:hypothetical protein
MNTGVQIDVLTQNGQGFSGQGDVAQRLLANGMNVNALRPWIGADGRSYVTMVVNGSAKAVPITNATTLRKDEWLLYDTAVIREARLRLNGLADLQSRGLVLNVNGLAKTIVETEKIGEFTPAELSMDGVNRTQGDRPVFAPDFLPLPIISKDYDINARVLAASRQTGETLDVTAAELATRQVIEKAEDILFNGSGTYKFGPTGSVVYGYRDFPSRNTGSLGGAWDASGYTGAAIINDVLKMKNAAIADLMYGPYVLYVPTAYETVLDNDFKANSDLTVRQRILQIANITDVKISDKMAQAGGKESVLLVQMTSDVVRLINGLDVTPVEWNSQGGMVFHYKVMMIKVPQIRATAAGRCGIQHFSEP